MTIPRITDFSEGRSINSPPLFDGSNYDSWRVKIKVFIQVQDYNLWNIIVNGHHTHHSSLHKNLGELNTRAMNFLYCALHENIFNQITLCSSVKDI